MLTRIMKDYQSTDRKPRWGPEISVGDSPRSAPRLLLVTFGSSRFVGMASSEAKPEGANAVVELLEGPELQLSW